MVVLEAARKITEMDVTSRELAPAITVLQLYLSSSKPVLRFAAVRTLNKVIYTWSSSLAVQSYSRPICFLIYHYIAGCHDTPSGCDKLQRGLGEFDVRPEQEYSDPGNHYSS